MLSGTVEVDDHQQRGLLGGEVGGRAGSEPAEVRVDFLGGGVEALLGGVRRRRGRALQAEAPDQLVHGGVAHDAYFSEPLREPLRDPDDFPSSSSELRRACSGAWVLPPLPSSAGPGPSARAARWLGADQSVALYFTVFVIAGAPTTSGAEEPAEAARAPKTP